MSALRIWHRGDLSDLAMLYVGAGFIGAILMAIGAA